MNKKLAELSVEELAQVSGGVVPGGAIVPPGDPFIEPSVTPFPTAYYNS